MNTLHRGTLVETLLNALEAERYVRASLLLTVIDELSAAEPLAPAAACAERLLAALETAAVGDAEFVLRVTELREMVRELSAAASPESGIRPRVVDAHRPSWIEALSA